MEEKKSLKTKKKALKTGDLSIGDAVTHIRGSPNGVVFMHDHARGLVKVRWESRVAEWVPPSELRLTSSA